MLGDRRVSVLLIDGPVESLSRLIHEPLAALSPERLFLRTVHNVDEAVGRLAEEAADLVLAALEHRDEALIDLDRLCAAAGRAPVIAFGEDRDERWAARVVERGAADYLSRDELAANAMPRAIRFAMERARLSRELDHVNSRLAHRERELTQAVEDRRASHEALTATQLQLLQVEKMESVGRLAAGIAHEVKNPLAIIATGIDFLKQAESATPEMMARVLGSMARAVARADSVIRGLLDFSAPAALKAEPCDLNTVVRQALLLVDHELMRAKIDLTTELAHPLPAVSIDANKIEQVFLNLFMNAIHAMPNGGRLTLRTSWNRMAALGHNIGDNRAERLRAGDCVVVAEVDDTGHGIPEDKLAKVFDPFFTTKPTGKGTGLGLSVARTIIELHGGLLQLTNRPEGGARGLLVLKASGDLPHECNEPFQDPGADRR